MKIGWIVYFDEDDFEKGRARFMTEEPDEYMNFKIIRIVYSEIV